MDRTILTIRLSEAINENLDAAGWCDLMVLGKAVQEKGVDYRMLGYERLFQLIKDYRESVVWKIDECSRPGSVRIKVRAKTPEEQKKYRKMVAERKSGQIDFSADPGNALMRWAYFNNLSETIRGLSELALPERWYFSRQNPANPFPILVSYLKYTFYRLTCETGKILESEEYAVFNTGLVDRRFEPIYALFERTPSAMRKYRLIDFCIAGEEREGKEMIRQFRAKPQKANYFDRISDMIYDIHAPDPECDWNHIVLENINRLPHVFLNIHCPKGFFPQDTDTMSVDEKEEYFNAYACALKADRQAYREVTYRLKDALELALRKINWNFKTAIPMYYPPANRMSLLLPLAVVDDDVVDVALVVEKTRSGNYLGHTILPLEWAYSNARLVCIPDSDWLTPEYIEEEIVDEYLAEE